MPEFGDVTSTDRSDLVARLLFDNGLTPSADELQHLTTVHRILREQVSVLYTPTMDEVLR